MRDQIYSPGFDEIFIVGDNEEQLDINCPIDGTPLVSRSGPDSSRYVCKACGADYIPGIKNAEALRERAEQYLRELESRKADLTAEVNALERTLARGKEERLI